MYRATIWILLLGWCSAFGQSTRVERDSINVSAPTIDRSLKLSGIFDAYSYFPGSGQESLTSPILRSKTLRLQWLQFGAAQGFGKFDYEVDLVFGDRADEFFGVDDGVFSFLRQAVQDKCM